MTPGALTPAERLECVAHWHWCALNPRLPPDPDLRFRDGLLRRPATKKEKTT